MNIILYIRRYHFLSGSKGGNKVTEENKLETLDTGKAPEEKETARDTSEALQASTIDRSSLFSPFNEAAVILFFILVFLLLFYRNR